MYSRNLECQNHVRNIKTRSSRTGHVEIRLRDSSCWTGSGQVNRKEDVPSCILDLKTQDNTALG
ncbi:hypothetical protein BpHYR1_012315 [Brachionus plicatilis]|uniref:Uncharacterized protein n=1 Tax=Brachionus plicatilis TaxID=10195 RepID=A0A3M7R6T4_BRAPC|nr:hypothetical protein BpHYR1_012315 [Brachionus plicatilis]